MRPTVRQLEYALAVARELSFRRAAEACHVTQPALSVQIRDLEALLGVRLFERDKRHVFVTPAGEPVLERIRRALSSLDDVVDAARAQGQPLAGRLRLGVIPTVAPYVLPWLVPRMGEHFPHCTLRLVENQTAKLVEDLERGELDLLLLAAEADLGSAHVSVLFEDPFRLVAPEAHPLAKRKRVRARDLDGETVLLLDDGHCLRTQAMSLCRAAGAHELGDFRATSLATLTQMVAHGLGLTVLPDTALESELARCSGLVARPFESPGPFRSIALAWRPSSPFAAQYEELAGLVRDAAPWGRRPMGRAKESQRRAPSR